MKKYCQSVYIDKVYIEDMYNIYNVSGINVAKLCQLSIKFAL